MTVLFSEDFNGNVGAPGSSSNGNFAGGGFQPVAAPGQLDSDYWRITGFSELAGLLDYGATAVTVGDYARGALSGNPTTAGVYSVATGVAALGASSFVVQPTAGEFGTTPGTITLRVQYTGATALTGFSFDYDGVFRNNADRDSFMNFSWAVQAAATQPTIFSATVGALSYTTPQALDATGWQVVSLAEQTFTNIINPGDYIFLRWTVGDVGGTGSRDELGFDNIKLTGVGGSTGPTISISPTSLSQAEGNSGATPYAFAVTRSSTAADTSVSVTVAGGAGLTAADIASVTVDGVPVAGFVLGTAFTIPFTGATTAAAVVVNIVGDTNVEATETFSVTLSNPGVGFVIGAPTATATVTNDDVGATPIYVIQGAGHTSPLVGQIVNTSGIVTAVDTNGFYLQDLTGDGDIGTSDGIFVFTGTAPTVAVGNAITLTATVTEFTGSTAGSLSLTQLTSPTSIFVTSAVNALPAPVLISTDGTPGSRTPPTSVIENDGFTSYDPTLDGIDFWESLEGMRVTLQTPLVVANTNSFGETYVVTSGGTGATGVNDRGGITISSGDYNPEKIQIDDDSGIFAGYTPGHTQGDRLSSVTGILNYAFAEYEIIVTQAVTTTTDITLARETTNLVGDATRFSYASFNLENLDPTDPASKLLLHATEIVQGLRSPDIIGVQEIQDADGAGSGTNLSGQATAQLLIDAVAALGGPIYRYVEIAPTTANTTGGEPGGNIRNGFFYNTARVTYVEGSAALIDTAAYAGSRRPLVADFMFNGERFTSINLHSTSRGGSDPLWGAIQPPADAGASARTAQAAGVRAYIDAALAIDPARKFVVNGDFNGFYFETALTNLTAGGVLGNLYDLLPVQERYSYIFGGNYQTLDHILVTGSLVAGAAFDVVHYNAFVDASLRATDHDQPIATIGQARTTGTAVAVADGFTTTEAAFYRGTVLANDTGGNAGLVVATVNGIAPGTTQTLASGAKLTLLADGTYTYDPDGAFAALNTGATTTDSFSYTLPGGSSATASITITGITAATPGAGNDTLTGTPADDSFTLSGGGNDTVSGGAGNDAFAFGAAFTALDRVNGGSGTNDQVGLEGNYAGGLTLNADTITNVEVLAVLPGFSYNLTSHDGNVAAGQELSVFGGNLLAGQNFTFNGSAETDGRFRMFGGLGTDTFTGGALDDGFYFGPGKWGAGDTVTGGGGTNDQLALDGNYTLNIGASAGVEALILLPGPGGSPNSFNITLDDVWTPAAATRTVWGLNVATAMTVDGSAETNGGFIFFGGQAGDTLTGGAGADAIYGGGGGDALRGNGGADVFRYDNLSDSNGTTDATRDRILDFASGIDRIDLSRIDAITGGADDAFTFIGTAAFSNVAGQLRYAAAGAGIFIVEGDVNGDGIADFTLSVAAAPPPLVTDFVL